MASLLSTVEAAFVDHYGGAPEHVVRAPGRVNLIGEHTDYNAGFVLPMAIDREVLIAARRRHDRVVRMVALDFQNAESEFSLDEIRHDEVQRWSNYVRGVAQVLQERGTAALPGLDLVIHGNVPLGAGLSSSAALEVAAAKTFVVMGGLQMGGVDIAKWCQKAENDFVGVKSGIMDQFISVLAHAGHALLIDCRDLSYRSVPMPRGATIVVCDTNKRRGLVSSEYNTRRAECEEAVRRLRSKTGKPIHALRDVTLQEFARFEAELPPAVARRARHVISENQRVLDAVEVMKRDDLVGLGRLMNQSHESLKENYEVSCPELDAMVEIARQQAGCFGARLTGAGFGGCTVNLVRDATVPAFVASVPRGYRERTGLEPHVYVCRAMAGASVIS